jgi:DNA topoisomerase-1
MNESGPKLLIVESPAKIKTISKFLGKDFKIMSTFGHVKDLPARKLGVLRDEKTHKIDVEYTAIKDKSKVIADICKEATRCSEIYLASDPDREGEIISWHIGQEIAKVFADEAKIYRITFNEITKSAILESIQNQSHVDMNKVQAQQARRVLDRWVGYEVSPILWQKITKGLSAGRVQSVAVLLVCIRESEIKAFVPEESWSIHGIFIMGGNGTSVSAELYKISNKSASIKTKEDAEKIIAEIKKEQYSVAKITDKKRSKNPTAPFMTSTLQQDSYNKLNFSVDKTMLIAQKLYEGVPLSDKNTPVALITYMRTDSLRIADSALETCRSFIKKNYGNEYLPKSANVYSKKGAQDAHEAIRPIDVNITPEQAAKYLHPDQAKLYGLIWKRFVACQMEAAEYFQRMVSIEGGKFAFKLTGSTLIFDGFLKVYMVEDDEEGSGVALPKELAEKMPMELKKLDKKQHFTQPPPRYTEATLVKEMEKKGIGRPSTYAATLSTIQKRGYVLKDNKRFVPTELGQTVNDLLVKNLPDIISVTFTAKMEEDLDKIAQGDVDRDVVLNEFYEKFEKDLETFGIKAKKHSVETDIKCPLCGSPLVIRYGKAGSFLGCSKFPTCAHTANYKRDEQDKIVIEETQDVVAGELGVCPNCSKPLVKKMGKFGPFIACSGYPDCKYIHQEALKMPCPNCGKKVTQRRWRGGKFWGCSGYPECKFSIFSAVVETPCPKCKSPYLLVRKDKEGNETHTCPNKECGFSENIGHA